MPKLCASSHSSFSNRKRLESGESLLRASCFRGLLPPVLLLLSGARQVKQRAGDWIQCEDRKEDDNVESSARGKGGRLPFEQRPRAISLRIIKLRALQQASSGAAKAASSETRPWTCLALPRVGVVEKGCQFLCALAKAWRAWAMLNKRRTYR